MSPSINQVGDRVGVMRKESGVLHFYVNGDAQGPAATNVPDRIYGVIDLYGQAAQDCHIYIQIKVLHFFMST